MNKDVKLGLAPLIELFSKYKTFDKLNLSSVGKLFLNFCVHGNKISDYSMIPGYYDRTGINNDMIRIMEAVIDFKEASFYDNEMYNKIINSPYVEYFRRPPKKIKTLYRTTMFDGDIDEYLDRVEKQKEIRIKSKRTGTVSYSTTVQGIYNYAKIISSAPPEFIVVKNFRFNDFLLDFENLYLMCKGKNEYKEDEVWMKATDYYSVANMDEIEVM